MENSQPKEIVNVLFSDDETGLPPSNTEQPTEQPKNPLDSEDVQARYRKYRACFDSEWELQGDNRILQARDEAFYDHNQWADEDRTVVEGRGQKCTVMNKIKIVCDWLIGNERKNKIDGNVIPREGADVALAEPKKELLQYVDDANKGQYARSASCEKQIKAGVGWLEVGMHRDEDKEPAFLRNEDWRNMWYDSNSREPDYSDARYVYRRRKVDLDIAVKLFPERKDELEAAAIDALEQWDSGLDDEFSANGNGGIPLQDSDGYRTLRTGGMNTLGGSNILNGAKARPMVDLIECWYREPLKPGQKILGGGQDATLWQARILKGDIYDETDPLHNYLLDNQICSLYDTTKLYTRCMVWEHRTGLVCQDVASPYRHNRIPFIPIWCWRESATGAPYGVPRGLISTQEDINKRYSKALFMLTARQVLAENNAIDNEIEFMKNLANPMGLMKTNEGKLGSVQILGINMTEAQYHTQMLQMLDSFIVQNSGIQQDNLGMETNAQSGVAIQKRQNEGSLTTYAIPDNQTIAFETAEQLMLSNIEQFYTDRKLIRILGARSKVDFLRINDVDEDGNEINPIYKSQADYKISTQDHRETMRMAQFEELGKMLGQMPEDLKVALFDLYLDESDLKNKDVLVSRTRKITGQTDPDDPQAEQAQQPDPSQQLQMQTMQAQLEKVTAEIALLQEKAKSEQVNQQVKLQGVSYDDREMKTREARTLSDIQTKDHQKLMALPDRMSGGYDEKGMQSNNEGGPNPV